MSYYCNLQYFNHKNNTFVVSNMQYFQCGDFHGLSWDPLVQMKGNLKLQKAIY